MRVLAKNENVTTKNTLLLHTEPKKGKTRDVDRSLEQGLLLNNDLQMLFKLLGNSKMSQRKSGVKVQISLDCD
jgi:hypothetical protein